MKSISQFSKKMVRAVVQNNKRFVFNGPKHVRRRVWSFKMLPNSDQNQSACDSWTQLPDVEFQWPNKDKIGREKRRGDKNVDSFAEDFCFFFFVFFSLNAHK